jgi:hypothetical protein
MLGNNLALDVIVGTFPMQLEDSGDSAIAEYSDCSYDRISSVPLLFFFESFVVLRIQCICSFWNQRASNSLTSVRPALLNNIRTSGCLDDLRKANTSCLGVYLREKDSPKIVLTNSLTALAQPTDDDIDFFGDLLPDQMEATITTDGGGELSKSHEFTKICNLHGYEVNSTAADSSSQNGMVKLPHRTVKERMRCMMYSARLGT